MQSNDYKPGVSGWRLEKGVLYINSATIQVGTLPAEPQLITVTAGEWSEDSLPRNALDRYGFFGAEIVNIPFEWRCSAELTTRDESYNCDGSDIRTTLTYRRLETVAEVEARHAKVAKSGKRIEIRGGGWELYDEHGVVRACFGPSLDDERQARVQAGEAAADQVAAVAKAATVDAQGATESLQPLYAIRLKVNEAGQYVAAGVGLSAETSKPRAPTNVASFMEAVGAIISESSLAASLQPGQFAEDVREVIAGELRPGGLLHRHHGAR